MQAGESFRGERGAALTMLALLVFAGRLAAQFPSVTTIPAGNFVNPGIPAVTGPNGEIWVAGTRHLMRLDRDGRPLFTTRLEIAGGITGVAVDNNGTAAVATTDGYSSSSLVVLDAQGRVLVTQKIPGFPAAIAADNQGNVLIAGRASAGFFGTWGAYKTDFADKDCSNRGGEQFACDDAFVMKLRLDGTRVWATLFGGSRRDSASALALDPSGSIWIAGETMSANLPTTANALQPTYGGGETLGPLEFGDAFLARFDANGARLEYATYLGGFRLDRATTLTATASGVVVAGATESPNFPTTAGAYQRTLTDSTRDMPSMHNDSFVSVVSRSGALVYSTLYGEAGRPGTTATAAAAGPGDEVAVSVSGTSRRCLLRLEVQAPMTKFAPDCFLATFEAPFTPLYANKNWIAAGSTKPGLDFRQIDRARMLTIQRIGEDNPGPEVAGIWNDAYPAARPVVAPDSFVSIYLPTAIDLSNVSVHIGGVALPILYAADKQINALIPASVSTGTQLLTVDFPFFSSVPAAIDVIERWPGLASAALNEDGTVNSSSNPAERGSIVSLFGTGFGPAPLPVLEPYILSTGSYGAQGMELLFAGRVAEGLFQLNTRIPQNAVPGHTPVRIVLRMPDGFVNSNLARIYVR